MKVRIIKTEDCQICQEYLPRLDKIGFEYETYDADDPVNDAELDKWGIDDLPVIQLIDGDLVRHQFPPRATLSPRMLNFKIEEIQRNDRRHNASRTEV